MEASGRFILIGAYRTQSQSVSSPAELTGTLGGLGSAQLTCKQMNHALSRDIAWRGNTTVSLAPAFVEKRSGVFERCADILYKANQFEPRVGSPAMATNLVDVRKAGRNWRTRLPFVASIVGYDAAQNINRLIGNVEGVASDEYMLHEAGHALGLSTEEKYAAGYFRVDGKIAAPLIFIEELRADLLSFDLAADNLSADRAAAVFLYNVFLRFGHHAQALSNAAVPPYGTIPFLLFRTLLAAGLMDVGSSNSPPLNIHSLAADDLVRSMRICARHARANLLDQDMTGGTTLDIALGAANYHASAILDTTAARAWRELERRLALLPAAGYLPHSL